MENEVRINVKVPADLLADVKLKAEKNNTTVSALVRNFFIAYAQRNNEPTFDSGNSIYTYHEVANEKRRLKENARKAYINYKEKQSYRDETETGLNKQLTENVIDDAKRDWKSAISEYRIFCSEHLAE